MVFGPERCSCCCGALKWLGAQGLEFRVHDVRYARLTQAELRIWWQKSGLALSDFFKQSGPTWHKLDLAERFDDLDDDEKLTLLVEHPLLLKRPLLVSDDFVFPGFSIAQWKKGLHLS